MRCWHFWFNQSDCDLCHRTGEVRSPNSGDTEEGE